MAGIVKTNELPVINDLTGATIIGVDKNGVDAQFKLDKIVRSERNVAYPNTNPSFDPVTGGPLTHFAGETWPVDTASYGSAFPGFGNITVPVKVGDLYVANARFVWNAGAWKLQRELVAVPQQDISGLTPKTDFFKVAEQVSFMVSNFTFTSFEAGKYYNGNVGDVVSLMSNASFNYMDWVACSPGDVVEVTGFYSTSATARYVVYANALNVITGIGFCGSDFATGAFTSTAPTGTTKAGFVWRINGGASWPVSSALIKITTPIGLQVKPSAVSYLQDDINTKAITLQSNIDSLASLASPVTEQVTTQISKSLGITTGTVAGTVETVYVFGKKLVDASFNNINFIASGAGAVEIILFTKAADGTQYNTEVFSLNAVVGDNNVSIAKTGFTGYIGGRRRGGNWYVNNAYSIDGGLAAITVTAGASTPVQIPIADVETVDLATYSMSISLNYTEPLSENIIINRLNNLEAGGAVDLFSGINYIASGDSITSHDDYPGNYADKCASWMLAANYLNVGIGGATWAWRAGTTATSNPLKTDDTNVMPNQALKIMSMYDAGTIPYPHLITLSAGTNDVGRDHALGDITTEFNKAVDSVNMYSVVGSMRWTLTKLMQKFPTAFIAVMTPLITSNATRYYLKSDPYAKIIAATAARLGVPVINQRDECQISETNQSRYYNADQLHPNAIGQQIQGLYVFRQLKQTFYKIP